MTPSRRIDGLSRPLCLSLIYLLRCEHDAQEGNLSSSSIRSDGILPRSRGGLTGA
jgi:hypothetical protein